ncbi:MAG: hydantoinase/oxoprolinase family protein [Desulfovibrionales bacterium]|nr:hydantoinase/oxoprolinase family protein [Desulfovibrionales bacterium]
MLIGIDVGGTHTDGVCIQGSRVEVVAKVPTDHDNLLGTITEVLQAIVRDCPSTDIRTINLSTTLSTNTIVTNRSEPVGMFVIPGPGIDAQSYALGEQYHILGGCVDHRGAISAKIRPEYIKPMAKVCRDAGVRVYGVVGKFCTRNPEQEIAAAQALAPQADFITQGHRVSEALNFGRRISTSYYNSAVWRTFNAFVDALEQSLSNLNIQADLNIVKADGGTMPLKLAREIPVQSIFSGPAASVMGILATSPAQEDALMLDIGGTTTDMAVLLDGIPLLERDGIAIGQRPTLVRALHVESIGIGGDSCITSYNGQLQVGPDRHGPCMAAGGPSPALMDAMNVLGYASLGDRERSAQGIKELAMTQGMSARECAEQAVRVAMSTLKNKVTAFLDVLNSRPVYTIQEMVEDRKVAPKRILATGGPAEAMTSLLEETFDLPVTAPPHSQVANAIGAALTRPTQSLVLTVDTSRGSFTVPGLGIHKAVKRTYTLDEAVVDATTMLRAELDRQGIPAEDGDIQIIQAEAFNMVDRDRMIGRNIRVRCQMRPGVITTLDA